jgi:hypothetical protein
VVEPEVEWAVVVACSASKIWTVMTAIVVKEVERQGALRKIITLKMVLQMAELIVEMPS